MATLDDRGRHRATREFWERRSLGAEILEALERAGADVRSLTVDDLAPLDQFHAGGMAMTRRLARMGELAPGMKVLDVGGGLGGPARTLAAEFDCIVTMSDVVESYASAAALLTDLLGLQASVSHVAADALDLPFGDEAFDVIWTQNSGMNIADKDRLYREFHRVLRPGGRLLTQEPMAGPVQPLIFPVMWAHDASTSFLRPPEDMQRVIEAAGFRTFAWKETAAVKSAGAKPVVEIRIQALVMGDEIDEISAAGRRNNAERRLVMVQAVFERA